jgi:hypothetical protein
MYRATKGGPTHRCIRGFLRIAGATLVSALALSLPQHSQAGSDPLSTPEPSVTEHSNEALPQNTLPDDAFLGTYEELQPAQQRLVDDWYAQYNRMTGAQLSPTHYNHLSISTRTTFEAVTHALLKTNLTDRSGKVLGNALHLVQSVETVSGKVPNARGDLQFRVYVLLTPTALDTLTQCQQFYRDVDNTVFHRGYPVNYRQSGGEPSIQISISRDGRQADIDVDYRSPKFPMALFNGHLTAANSDVRAGNNTQRHERRWIGLTNWWRDLFGLPGREEVTVPTREGEIPTQPRNGKGKLDEAVQDFLSSWLTEQKPELAAAYLSPRSFACLEEYGPQAGTHINAGLAPYAAAKDMAAVLHRIGKIKTLQDAVSAYSVDNISFKPVKQRKNSVFSLSQLTNRAATYLECDAQRAYDDFDRFRSAGALNKFGNYYSASFRLRALDETGDGITLVWAKENKTWKIVAWDIETEEGSPEKLPDIRPAGMVTGTDASPAATKVNVDPGFRRAAAGFFRSWLIKEDSLEAATYFSSRCYACIDLNLADDERPPSSTQEQENYIRTALATVSKEIGRISHLSEALESVSPEHQDLQLISHHDRSAYSLVAVPDYLAEAFLCANRSAGNASHSANELPVYGTYYAVLFALRTPGEHAPAVRLLWTRNEGQWKIIAYKIDN